MFQYILLHSDIVCNNDTKIDVLIDKIIGMFLEDYTKDVIYCKLIRDNTIFDDTAVLGDYSSMIQEWGNSTGLRNYFYINVVLQDLSTDNSTSSVSTDIKNAGSKRRKTNKRRRTRKQRKPRK